MKKGLIAHLLLALIAATVTAQSYQPLLDSTSWKYAWKNNTSPAQQYWWHTVGDTVIGGKSYVIIQHDETDPTLLSWFNKRQFLREDTVLRKVYYRDTVNSADSLLYDFDLSVGDSILYPRYITGTPSNYMHVDKIVTVLTEGGFRKQFVFDTILSPIPVTLTESVGWNEFEEADFRIFDPSAASSFQHQYDACIYQARNLEYYANTTYCYCESMCPSIGLLDTLHISADTICEGDSVLLRAPCDTNTYWLESSTAIVFGSNRDSVWVHPNVSETYYWHGSLITDSLHVHVIPRPSINLNESYEFCEGDSALLIPNFFPPGLSISWSTNSPDQAIFVASAGIYWVRGEDEYGCFDFDTTFVFENPNPQITVIDSVISVNADLSSLALNNCTPSGGTYSGTGVSNNTFNPLIAGIGIHEIRYVYIDLNGCRDTAYFKIDVLPVGISSIFNRFHISLYPNPTSGEVYLSLDQPENFTIQILNSLGTLISEWHYSGSEQVEISFPNSCESGVYFLRINSEDGGSSLMPVVLER